MVDMFGGVDDYVCSVFYCVRKVVLLVGFR